MLPTNNRIIDVRSEHEFEKGTIPNSFNIPILNDDEYKLVGIDYKKYGQDSAIKLGESLVTGEKKQRLIDNWIKTIKKHNIEYIFCKRGGLRSRTAKKWLKEEGVDIKILVGGYKSYRKDQNKDFILIRDKIRGEIEVDLKILDDKIIFKNDGMPTYHLANVVLSLIHISEPTRPY